MREQLAELWKYRELLIILVQRDLKVRYKNSALGFGWSLLNPLLQVLTIAIVLQFLMATRVENYHAYLFCATLPWLFFSTAIMDSADCLLKYQDLIRRTYFPRELIPLASVAANLIHFGLATLVFLAYMTANALFFGVVHGKLQWPLLPTVLLLPIPMLGLTLLVTGIALFISRWTMYFEDIRFLADSGLKILYWLVPIIWYPEFILRAVSSPQKAQWLYTLCLLNPLAAFINAFKKLALVPTRMPAHQLVTVTTPMTPLEWTSLGIAILTSLGILALGYHNFCRRKWQLAERA